MLISVPRLADMWGVNPETILHVGAHDAEEREAYFGKDWGSQGIVWVESQTELVEKLAKKLLGSSRERVINATAWDVTGEQLTFHISNNSQSSSLFEFGTHSNHHPDVFFKSERKVITSRLKDVLPGDEFYDFINLDIQGAELKAMVGLGDKISKAKWIYSEVNREEVYEGCAIIQEIDKYLSKFEFVRVATVWTPGVGWGDALWIKKSLIPRFKKRVLNKILFATWNAISYARFVKSNISNMVISIISKQEL